MNLYRVTYKNYNPTPETCAIVARTAESALEEAKMFIKKKHYGGSREITQVEKLSGIDRVARR